MYFSVDKNVSLSTVWNSAKIYVGSCHDVQEDHFSIVYLMRQRVEFWREIGHGFKVSNIQKIVKKCAKIWKRLKNAINTFALKTSHDLWAERLPSIHINIHNLNQHGKRPDQQQRTMQITFRQTCRYINIIIICLAFSDEI